MRTALALEARASLLHAVETPAIETAIRGSELSSCDVTSDGPDSTRASGCLSRRVRVRGASAATIDKVYRPPRRVWGHPVSPGKSQLHRSTRLGAEGGR